MPGFCSNSAIAWRTRLRLGAGTARPPRGIRAGPGIGVAAAWPRPVSSDSRWRIRSANAPSGICASIGFARSARRALPSSVDSVMPSPRVSKKNVDSGVAAARRASKPAAPSVRTMVSGSSPSGRNRKNA